jgi:hypothetical protein
MAPVAANDGTVENVESGEQRGSAVMSHRSGAVNDGIGGGI